MLGLSRAARWVALSFVLLLPGLLMTACRQPDADGASQLTIVTASDTHKLTVEVARTEAEKARGLMFRTSLPQGTGMLFPYSQSQEITMWMKNTYISLDMVFIRQDGTIHRIARSTEPMSEDIIASRGKVTAVLEIAAGEADRLGLAPGNKVSHPALGSAR